MADGVNRAASRRAFILSASAGAALLPWERRVLAGWQQQAGGGDEPPVRPRPAEPQSLADLSPQAAEGGGDSSITAQTIAEAEKLAGVVFTDDERAVIAANIADDVNRFKRRMAQTFPNELAPAQTFDPRLPGRSYDVPGDPPRYADVDAGWLPIDDEDIAFAPLTHLSQWLRRRRITSRSLTRIYLDRLKEIGPKLECVVTLTEDLAMEQATRADMEIARGDYRGPLHGIPWGAKDLLDTKGIATTWGAQPYRDRVPDADARVVSMLDSAGAVLVAKLSLGALAYGDIWFGGRTNNPFNLNQGSSGSSAGSAAAVAAGLVGFGLGTETLGSIVSPCMRCGTTGLRPTFGRVARTGAMALCWSLDKIGPIARRVEDCMIVLAAINGRHVGDPSSIAMPLPFDATAGVKGMRVGYNPKWFDGGEERGGHELDRAALDVVKTLPCELVEIELPDWPYDSLLSILMAEAASAFEELTLTNRDDELTWQAPEAWPNSFRMTRFTPAIEYVQAERLRRRCCAMLAERFDGIDAIIAPSYAASLLLITNNTGHPSLTIRTGITDEGAPRGITLIGDLYHEGRLANLAMAMEQKLGVWNVRPKIV